MKAKKPKSAKRVTISRLQKTLWTECKRIIRSRHGNTCYTCPKGALVGSNWHTGHMWPKAVLGAAMKYDLRILRPQCYDCNINKGGMGAVFYRRLMSEKGASYVHNLEITRQKAKNSNINAYKYYEELLIKYKELEVSSPISSMI